MRHFFGAVVLGLSLAPVAAVAYDPAPDQAMLMVLSERIDGDVNAGLLPNDRAALMRAELAATQKLITAADSQATAMLADIDRDVSTYDHAVDINEAGRDLQFHIGDTVTIAMRDGVAWQVEKNVNADIMDRKSPTAQYPPGVLGAYLAKQPGYTAITLVDPVSARRVTFRFYVVEKAAAALPNLAPPRRRIA